jgi:O-antigen/teichoic acid export membrane protein
VTSGRRRRQFGLLSVSFFTASGFGLLLLVIVARWLGPAENAHFQVQWALIFAFGSVLGSLEQEVTRRATSATLDGRRTPVGAVQAIAVAALACLVLLGVVVATPQGRDIVQGSSVIVALTILSVINFSALVLARGVLLGTGSLRRYAAVLAGEAVLRPVLVGVLVLAGVEAAAEWAVFATVISSLIWLGVLHRVVSAVDWPGTRDSWTNVGGTVAALAIASGLSALLLTGFPFVAALVIGEPTELAVLFGVITLSRAPLVLLAPVQALTVPTVVRWSRQGDTHHLARALRQVAGGSAVAAALGGAVAYVLGPWAVELVLGAEFRPTPGMVAVVTAATCVIAGALLLAAVLVALQRYWQLTACWAASIAAAAVVMLAAPLDAEQRALWGIAAASAVAFLGMVVAVRRSVAAAEAKHERASH